MNFFLTPHCETLLTTSYYFLPLVAAILVAFHILSREIRLKSENIFGRLLKAREYARRIPFESTIPSGSGYCGPRPLVARLTPRAQIVL
jgi:hypothetical protein